MKVVREIEEVYYKEDDQPQWSPDSKMIAYLKREVFFPSEPLSFEETKELQLKYKTKSA